MTASDDNGWPRELQGHLIRRTIRSTPGGRIIEFRCEECGRVFAELDERRLRRADCSVAAQEREGEKDLSPDAEGI